MIENTDYLIRAYKKYNRRFVIPQNVHDYEEKNAIPQSKRVRKSKCWVGESK